MADNTFRVDNFILQNQTDIYAARRPKGDQLLLPGFAPLPPFEFWATLACYSILDPSRPANSVFTPTATLLETLCFARIANEEAGGHDSYPSDAYRMVEQAMERLHTTPVYWRGYWKVKTGKKGRPRRQWIEYSGYILPEFTYVYREGVTPPSQARDIDRKNVTEGRIGGEFRSPVWKLTNGPRPIGVEFRFASMLVAGLTGEGPNIGNTIMPLRLFDLRPAFGPYPLATRLLMKVIREVNPRPRIGIDKLIRAIKIEGRNHSRNRKTVLEYLDMIQSAGVVSNLAIDSSTGVVSFAKGEGWYFPSGLLLPENDEEE